MLTAAPATFGARAAGFAGGRALLTARTTRSSLGVSLISRPAQCSSKSPASRPSEVPAGNRPSKRGICPSVERYRGSMLRHSPDLRLLNAATAHVGRGLTTTRVDSFITALRTKRRMYVSADGGHGCMRNLVVYAIVSCLRRTGLKRTFDVVADVSAACRSCRWPVGESASASACSMDRRSFFFLNVYNNLYGAAFLSDDPTASEFGRWSHIEAAVKASSIRVHFTTMISLRCWHSVCQASKDVRQTAARRKVQAAVER